MVAILIDPFRHKIIRLQIKVVPMPGDTKTRYTGRLKLPNPTNKYEFENSDILAVDEMLNADPPDNSLAFSGRFISGRAITMGRDSQTDELRDTSTTIEELTAMLDFCSPKRNWLLFSFLAKKTTFFMNGIRSLQQQEPGNVAGPMPNVTISQIDEFLNTKF
jgi:hypothetical protein